MLFDILYSNCSGVVYEHLVLSLFYNKWTTRDICGVEMLEHPVQAN